MKIKINGSYYIDVTKDSYDAHYVRPQKKDPEKEADTALAFCSTIDRAVKRIVQHSMSMKDITVEMTEYLNRYEFISGKIYETLSKAGVE